MRTCRKHIATYFCTAASALAALAIHLAFPTLRSPLSALRPTRSALLIACLLFGCGGERAATTDGRKQVSVYLLLISTKQVEFYDWAEITFEAANPDVDIVIEQFPGSSLKDFEIKLRLRFSSRQAPDLFGAPEAVAGEYARLGLLEPAPDYIEEIVQEKALNAMARQAPYIDGTCYGVTSASVWQAMYYNKDMFREAGLDPERPPETWEELIDYADRLTIRNTAGAPIRTGLSLRKTGFKVGTAEKWFTFLYSAGGQAYNDAGTASAFNSPAGRDALAFYKTILFDENIDSVELEGDQQGFGQGRVAMFLREPHVIGWLQDNYPDLDFGVAPIPKGAESISSGGSYLWVVSKDSPHPDAAWRFVDFLMSDDVYARYAVVGGIIPMTKPVAALPQYSEDPYLKVFIEQEAAAVSPFPRMARASDIIGAYVERFCYGRIGIDDMLDRAQRDVDALLDRNKQRAAAGL